MGPKASLGWDSDSKVGTVSEKEMARAVLAIKAASIRDGAQPWV